MLKKKSNLIEKSPEILKTACKNQTLIDSGNPEEVRAVALVGCWFRLQINYKFIINYEVLPLALLSCGLRKRQILKSSEPISILFLASQSHKRSYLQLGDLLFYIPFMYRLISWCSDLWHLNRKDAYKKQRQSRRDPNTLPGPWQGQRKKGIHTQQPLLLLCPKEWEQSMPMDEGGCGRSLWGGKPQIARVSWRDGAHDLVSPSSIHLQLGNEGLLCSMVQIWCTEPNFQRMLIESQDGFGLEGSLKTMGRDTFH